jgi:hypothetical protein
MQVDRVCSGAERREHYVGTIGHRLAERACGNPQYVVLGRDESVEWRSDDVSTQVLDFHAVDGRLQLLGDETLGGGAQVRLILAVERRWLER